MNERATESRRQRKRIVQMGLPVLAAFGTVGALGYARGRLQRGQVFSPSRYPSEDWHPRAEGFPVEDTWFRSAAGLKLHGWWRPHPRSERCLLYCHGNSGSLAERVKVLQHLARLPVSLFAFDYRGYGKSEGRPSEAGLFEDVRAAFRHLVEVHRIPSETVVLFGHSLGGAVAIDGALDLPVAGLVVEASFTDIRSMARVRFPQVPAHWVARNEFRSISKVAEVRMPKLFIHGTRDKTVPFSMGRQLFEAAPEPKEFFAVDRGGHSDLYLRGGEAYRQTLLGFLDRCVSRQGVKAR